MAYPGQNRRPQQPAMMPAPVPMPMPTAMSAAAPQQMMPPPQLLQTQVPTTTNTAPPGAILYQVPIPSQAAVNSGFVALAPTQEQMQSHQSDPNSMISSNLPGSNAGGLLSFGENLVRAPFCEIFHWRL